MTSPAMISCKHLQGVPRPPNLPLQELTQELSSGTKQVMLWICCTLLHGGGAPTGCGTLPNHGTLKVHGTLPYHAKFNFRNYFCILFICFPVPVLDN